MNGLKKCPFCGGKAEIENVNIDDSLIGDYFMVECKECFGAVCFGDKSETKAGAIYAWNKRIENKKTADGGASTISMENIINN